ncbi:MAG: phage holin family protein [Promicromonosporaceae bacterium]|nr:phage holin family protein [Promicromonosporaceae bacterium]
MSASTDQSLGQLLGQLSEQTSGLVKAEIALAKQEMADKAKNSAIGIGLLVFAGLVGTYLVGVLILAAIYGFGNLVPMWAAALIVAAVMLLVIAASVAGGVGAFKAAARRGKAAASVKESVDAVKHSFSLKARPDAEEA